MFDYIRSKHNIIPKGKLRRKYLRKSHDVVEYSITNMWLYLPYMYIYIHIYVVAAYYVLEYKKIYPICAECMYILVYSVG